MVLDGEFNRILEFSERVFRIALKSKNEWGKHENEFIKEYVKLERSKNNLTLFSQKLFKLYALIEEEIKKEVKIFRRELSALEREKRQKETMLKLLELLDSKGPEEYLSGVKEMFQLKAIRVFSLKDSSVKECLIDQSSLTISMPVGLEEGSALVVFYLNHPAELMDTELKENLSRCAKMLSFYIAGFESKEQAVKIAV
jgi:hypothetical protein